MSKTKKRYESLITSKIESRISNRVDFLTDLGTEKLTRSPVTFKKGAKYNILSPMRQLQEIKKYLKINYSQIITVAKLSKAESNFASGNEDVEITLARLQALLEEEEDDDYGVTKPSAYAYGTALALVSEAARLMSDRFARASASTDDKGGIRLTWTRPEAEVRLVCAHQSDKPTYLYHETGDEYGVERDVSASTLAQWLDWLNNI